MASQVWYTHIGHYSMKVARIYPRVSTGEQDLTWQADIEHSSQAADYCIVGVYREKASGARAGTDGQFSTSANTDTIWERPGARRNEGNTP